MIGTEFTLTHSTQKMSTKFKDVQQFYCLKFMSRCLQLFRSKLQGITEPSGTNNGKRVCCNIVMTVCIQRIGMCNHIFAARPCLAFQGWLVQPSTGLLDHNSQTTGKKKATLTQSTQNLSTQHEEVHHFVLLEVHVSLSANILFTIVVIRNAIRPN